MLASGAAALWLAGTLRRAFAEASGCDWPSALLTTGAASGSLSSSLPTVGSSNLMVTNEVVVGGGLAGGSAVVGSGVFSGDLSRAKGLELSIPTF
jgi:hypothetical protein